MQSIRTKIAWTFYQANQAYPLNEQILLIQKGLAQVMTGNI